MSKPCRSILGLTLAMVIFGSVPAEAQETSAMPPDLVGAWRLVTRKLGNEERRAAANEVRLLLITPTHVSRVVYDPTTRKVVGTVGGPATAEGGKYTETIEWADEGSRRGRSQNDSIQFNYRLEKDQLILEHMAGDKKYAEVWERMPRNKQ